MGAHTSSLICTLYGNSPGNEVDEDNEGGLFTQCLVDCLRKSVKYNQTMQLLDLTIAVSKELEKVSDEEQMCWVDGDPKMVKKIFTAKPMKIQLFNTMKPSLEQQAMQQWFQQTLRLPQFFHIFVDSGYEDLTFFDEVISDNELIEMGIKKKPHRKKIIKEINKLLATQNEQLPMTPTDLK